MWTEIIVLFLGIPALVIYIIVQFRMRKSLKSIEVTANMPIIENKYRHEFTDGYKLGVQKSAVLKKNGCYLVEMYPVDVEQGEDIARPHLQSFVIKQEHYHPSLDGRRIIVRTTTRDPSRIPKEMRNTLDGDWETKEGQLAHLTSTFREAVITGGDEAIAEAMKNYARGNIPAATLAQLKSDVKAFKETLGNKPEEPKDK